MKRLVSETSERLIDVGELSGRIGKAERSCWRDLAADRLPMCIRVGRSVRWRSSEIDA